MNDENQTERRKRGPKPTGKGTPVLVRLQPELLRSLDMFIARSRVRMSRPEALRMAFREWSEAIGYLPHELHPEEGMRPEELNASNDD
ncbi:hypothetical protein [Nitratireductor luteus]|uniref:hypothetical protein n=1 Tax=Nitratireductor luteus TaxID=2976980 RepID=UPI0022409EE1|nr:hypothetical protein [Nitratireductor luteus]